MAAVTVALVAVTAAAVAVTAAAAGTAATEAAVGTAARAAAARVGAVRHNHVAVPRLVSEASPTWRKPRLVQGASPGLERPGIICALWGLHVYRPAGLQRASITTAVATYTAR